MCNPPLRRSRSCEAHQRNSHFPLGLLGRGSFQQQTGATLKGLCKQRPIPGYSKLKKADLARVLEQHGVEPPPRPLKSFSKKELIGLVKQLLES
jgi:hypothetical protein